jgi:Zn-dependent oligopeptidases
MRKRIVFITLLIAGLTILKMENVNAQSNPLLTEWNTPQQVPPFTQIKHEHYVPAIDEALKEARAEVDAIINSSEAPTFANTIVALELSGDKTRPYYQCIVQYQFGRNR